MKTGTARSLLPGRAPRWRYVERAPPARRRTGVVRSGGGNLDALLNEILEKHQSLFGEAEDGDGEEEESAMKRMLIENQDYADRQDVWPDGQDDSEYIRVPPLNIVCSARCLPTVKISPVLPQGPDPKKGSIGQQVSFDYQKAMLTDAVDPDHMRYWFTTPPGGPSRWEVSKTKGCDLGRWMEYENEGGKETERAARILCQCTEQKQKPGRSATC